jgi:hypothetical protein
MKSEVGFKSSYKNKINQKTVKTSTIIEVSDLPKMIKALQKVLK